MTSRSAGYSAVEDVLLCRIYLDVSQDPIIGKQQSSKQFWTRVAEAYDAVATKEGWESRNSRSLQCRMQIIEKAIRKLNGCYRQIENLHPSGAAEQDMLDQAKALLMQDPTYKKGFKYDHIWSMMKDVEKFKDCHSKKKIVSSQNSCFLSSESDNPTPDSPMVSTPNLSSFSIDLNEDTSGEYTSAKRPLGVKKAKLKKKLDESFSSDLKRIHTDNEKLVEELAKATAERREARMMRSRALDLKEFKEENKILLLDLNAIDDPIARETFRQEKLRIQQKRAQRQQPPPSASNMYGQYFNDIGGSGSDLLEY